MNEPDLEKLLRKVIRQELTEGQIKDTLTATTLALVLTVRSLSRKGLIDPAELADELRRHSETVGSQIPAVSARMREIAELLTEFS